MGKQNLFFREIKGVKKGMKTDDFMVAATVGHKTKKGKGTLQGGERENP